MKGHIDQIVLHNLSWESSAVRLGNGVTVVLGIKGFEDDQTKAKCTATNRWVEAANNWGPLRGWVFHVCWDPQLLDKEMEHLEQKLRREP
jgi:hypothetical protein